jgi:hypothetical protein
MTRQYRYLINNEVMQGGEMPNRDDYEQSSDVMYHYDLEQWRTSLVKLECSESEFGKIEWAVTEPFENIIDITSITTIKYGKVYFKEVESESQDVLLNDLIYVLISSHSLNPKQDIELLKTKFKIARI